MLNNKIILLMNIKLQRPLLRAALFFIAISFLMTGCEKPEEELGLELQPGSDLLSTNQVDTFSIVAYTQLDDSVRTERVSPGLVGAYNDPIFGFTKAGHITQLRLSSNNPNLIPDGATIDNIVVDSVVLVLDYFLYSNTNPSSKSVYGGLGEQYFQVFEVSDSLSVDSNYFEYSPVDYVDNDLIKEGSNRQKPNTTDSVRVGDSFNPAEMRIPLDESFANRFFEADAIGDLTPTTFESLIKGIYITVDETRFNTNKSGIISFDTFTDDSRVVLYYRSVLPDTTRSYSYSFEIRSSSAKYNKFDHEHANGVTSLAEQLRGNTEFGKQDLFVQSTAGTKLFLDLPFIENLRDSAGIAINKAKIVLPVRDVFGIEAALFTPPQQLLIFPRDENGKIYSLQNDNPSSYGFYNEEDGVYEFIISRYLQQVLLGEREHYGFEIVSTDANRSANRVVLNGAEYPDASNPSNNLKLVVTFTKF